MICLSPYRSSLLKNHREAHKLRSPGLELVVMWRNELGSLDPFARIYFHKINMTYRFSITSRDFYHDGHSFIDLKYVMHLLDTELKKQGCIFLTEERFAKLEALK